MVIGTIVTGGLASMYRNIQESFLQRDLKQRGKYIGFAFTVSL
jgi:hypothetical protein